MLRGTGRPRLSCKGHPRAVKINIHPPLPSRDGPVAYKEQHTAIGSMTTAATEIILPKRLSLTHALRIRPEFGSVASGDLDLSPVSDVATAIASSILADEGVSAEEGT